MSNNCKYCSNNKSDEINEIIISNKDNIWNEDEEFFIYIEDNLMIMLEIDDNGSSYLGDRVINYCPMCGRKLYQTNI